MKQSEKEFMTLLTKKAKQQAVLEQSSPLPEWTRPFFAMVGLHYWLFLIILSCVVAIPLSIWFFPGVYHRVTGL